MSDDYLKRLNDELLSLQRDAYEARKRLGIRTPVNPPHTIEELRAHLAALRAIECDDARFDDTFPAEWCA